MKKRKINYFKFLNLFFAIAVLVFIAGCNGTPPAVPIINSFLANSSIITIGESSTLSWSVTDATSVTIDNGIGSVALTGTTAVNPTTTTTYTLTSTNTAGSVTATTTVTVSSAAAAGTITYNGNGSTAGTVPVDPASPYESGTTVTVLGNTGDLTRINDEGISYSFTGWNTKADGSGTAQAEGPTFTMGVSDVTLYAQWTPYVLRDIGPAGGYIFYDKGYYSSGWRYFEAAPSDQSPKPEWGCCGDINLGCRWHCSGYRCAEYHSH